MIQSSAMAATRLDDEGISQGYINAIDCVGTGISCTRSGIVGTISADAGAGSGEINTASNVGNGIGAFKQKSTFDLQFKSFVSGDNVTMSQDANSISLNVASIPSDDITGIFDIDTDTNLIAGTLLSLNANGTLNAAVATSDVTGIFDVDADTNLRASSPIALSAAGLLTAAVTTADVTGIFAIEDGGTGLTSYSKGDVVTSNGTNLVKLAVGTDGTVLSADSSTASGLKWVTPAGGGSGEVNTASNVGTGVGVWKEKSVADLRFKSLVSGDNVVVSQDSNSIILNVPSIPSGDITTLGSLAGQDTVTDAQVPDDITITESDPKVGTLTNTKWCTTDGAVINCTTNAPSGSEAFPVGAIFISVVSTNPNTLLGYGTWLAFAAGRVLVGLDSGQTEFDTVEETGGAKTHTLVEAEIPAHIHSLAAASAASGGGGTMAYDNNSALANSMNTDSTGGGGAHNNLQPYITVYMWERTA